MRIPPAEVIHARVDAAKPQVGMTNWVGATPSKAEVMMSRYACYLVIQNADPAKEIVAHGQTYFAIQTRRQELSDEEMEEQRLDHHSHQQASSILQRKKSTATCAAGSSMIRQAA